jgi:predicted fused transcriptional regulator/phosphomethylpyrimidine kinase
VFRKVRGFYFRPGKGPQTWKSRSDWITASAPQDRVDLEVLNDQGEPGKEPKPWSILSDVTCIRGIKL